MKKWRGRSPHIKKVLAKKNNPIGHWTTQLCANLNSTNMPIIIGLYPFAGELDNNHPLETRSDIWTWVLELLKLGKKEKMLPAICADSFYLDNTAQNMLLDDNVIFHCSVKKNWFSSISTHLEHKVKDMGAWEAMENVKTGEVATFTWSGDRDIGKKFLISTLLKKEPGKQQSNNPPGWDAYKYMFDGCDRFNQQFSNFVWPYWMAHWTDHLDDIYQVHIALNTVAIWRELHPDCNCGTTTSILLKLAKELHERCVNNNLPSSQW